MKEHNSKKLSIVYGIGGNNTFDCLKAIDETDFDGVESILSVSPYYNKPSQSGIIKHYQKLAEHSPVPIILYNVPGRTSSNITWQTTAELAKNPKIIGIKEASGNLEQCMRVISKTPDDFLLISGDDLLTGPLLAIGGKGVISVLANAFPAIFHTMMEAHKKGDYGKINAELFRLLEINPHMYSEGNPVGIKEVLRQMGICNGEVRLPHVSASETLKKDISLALAHLKRVKKEG